MYYPAHLCLMTDMPLGGVRLINLGFNLIEHVNSPVGESLEGEAHMCSFVVNRITENWVFQGYLNQKSIMGFGRELKKRYQKWTFPHVTGPFHTNFSNKRIMESLTEGPLGTCALTSDKH